MRGAVVRPAPRLLTAVWGRRTAAMTLGRYILVRPDVLRSDRRDAVVAHELEHVDQWRRHGVAGFLARYLGAYLRARFAGVSHGDAYRSIPFEVDARRAETPPSPPSPAR